MKTFTVAGTSVENGVTKFRVANDLAGRIKMLERCENTDIVLDELPEPMTKQSASQYVLDNNLCSEDAEEAVAKVVKAASSAPAASKPKIKKAAKKVVDAAVDEDSDGFKKLVAEKRELFPSHTDQQLMDLVRFQAQANMKAFGDLEPNF